MLVGMGIDYESLSDREADLFAKVNVTKLALALAEQDCEVISMQERDEGLESYYINLVGGGKSE